MYRIATLIVCAVTIYIWIIDPVFRSLHRLFCYDVDIVGDAQDTPFTATGRTPSYVPTIKFKNELYMCSFIRDLLPRNKPSLLRATPGDLDDLSVYVPLELQPHVLSVVKYYGDPLDTAEQGGGGGGLLVRAAVEEGGIPETTTVGHAKYVTDEKNVLELVSNSMPLDLLEKINGKRAENVDPPLSPEERKARRIKRNINARSSEPRLFPSQATGRARINPLPAISSENRDDGRPVSTSLSAKNNRLVLRPISNDF